MSNREITVLTDVSLITCIVQRGYGDQILQAAREAGAQGATIHYARGSGVRERLGALGVAVEVEKEVIDIMVSNDQVDRLFEKIYVAAELGTPGRGLMYITALEKAATYIPSEILEKLDKRGLVREGS
jgi:nitrogen regulatory protein PII